MKRSPKSLWARNFELSLASIVIAVTGQVLGEGAEVRDKGFFFGFDWLVWATVALQSFGGILVALVVKYADNILKARANNIVDGSYMMLKVLFPLFHIFFNALC